MCYNILTKFYFLGGVPLSVCTLCEVFTWYEIIMTNNNVGRNIKRAKSVNKSKGFDFLAVVSVAFQLICMALCGAFVIGCFSIAAVCAGKYVQPWWIPFAKFAIYVTIAFGIFLATVIMLVLVYGFSWAMAKRSRRLAFKMYPEHRKPWLMRERRCKAICGRISKLKRGFLKLVKLLVAIGDYAPL